ncbi:Large ribosomal subunit protein uL5c-like protein, partial [Drosera capensis]
IPKLEKIVVNCGMGDASQNKKGLESVIGELARIMGKKPVRTKTKNVVANSKIREGQTVGFMIILRKNLMYSFLDRLINLALPRVRDLQGVNPNSFDGNGNFSMGFGEQSVSPEISYDAFGTQRGMDFCISTTTRTDKEAYRLLTLMGMPFKEGTTGPTVAPKKKKKRFDDPKKGKGGG